MTDELTALVVRAQRGDLEAFEKLLTLYQRRIFYTIFRIVGEAHSADDLTQEVFIKVHASLPRLKEPHLFQRWVFRIAINRAIDRKRAVKKANESAFLVDDVPAHADGSAQESLDRMETGQMQEALDRAISDLPDPQREVLALTIDKNLSHEEIAQIVDCPVGTVKSRLHHARKAIKEKLERWLGPL